MDKKNIRQLAIIGVIIFICIALLIKLDSVLLAISSLLSLLVPLLIGVVMAFIFNRPVILIKSLISKIFPKLKPRKVNGLGIAITYLLFVAIFIAIITFVVPQIKDSIILFSNNFDQYYDNFTHYYTKLADNDTFGVMEYVMDMISKISINLPNIIEKTYNITSNIILGVTNTFIGIIISIYILIDKERLKEMTSSFFGALLPKKKFDILTKYYRIVSETFSKFISGQIIEAFILGALCFIGMTIFGFDYAPLISTLICITALVPVVGAIIGTIPSALVLLLVKPIDAVWFIIFIIILQQLENNLIYPKVVGKSVGLPPLLVLLSIILGAGLGGIAGILLGVPLMSVLYIILKEYITTHRHEYNVETPPESPDSNIQ